MKLPRRRLLKWSSWLAPSLFVTWRWGQAAHASASREPLAIVVAKNSALGELSFYDLKRLYLGDKLRAPDGTNLIPLNRGTSAAERLAFDHSVLGMTPAEVARYWIDRRIRGQTGAPKAIDPGLVLQRVVAKLPGAVGYVLASEVSSTVKVVHIDGKLPGQTAYPVSALFGGNAAPSPASPSQQRRS
jgi:hypothetical protein